MTRQHPDLKIPASLLPNPPTLFSPSTTHPKPTLATQRGAAPAPPPAPPIPAKTNPKKDTQPQQQQSQEHTQSRATLQTHARILQLVHYRSKNQHGRAHWYRHLSTFRREVLRVCALLEIPLDTSLPSRPLATTAKFNGYQSREVQRREHEAQGHLPLKRRQRLAAEKIQQRVAERARHWIRHGLVGKWYAAFTHVVTTTQFSALGLCLVGCLARLCKVLGIVEHFKVDGGIAGKVEIGEIGEGVDGYVRGLSQGDNYDNTEDNNDDNDSDNDNGNGNYNSNETRKRKKRADDMHGLDLGVKIERRDGVATTKAGMSRADAVADPGIDMEADARLKRRGVKRRAQSDGGDADDDHDNHDNDNDNDVGTGTNDIHETQTTEKEAIPRRVRAEKNSKKKKRRKEGGDAIDDLFAGLV